MISAHFFLPDFVKEEQKKELVDSVVQELGLGKTVDTIVGDEKVRGVSGGERKRANIAVQLITDPSVLFLDEPTSGLDSFQAQAVMEAMKNMATCGRLVISVIHQPRSSIYDMFDKVRPVSPCFLFCLMFEFPFLSHSFFGMASFASSLSSVLDSSLIRRKSYLSW
jgi:ABC-type Mn2+/Zn2+ transport system ATPase subunit